MHVRKSYSQFRTRRHKYTTARSHGKVTSFSGKRRRGYSAPSRKRARTSSTYSNATSGISVLAGMRKNKTSTDSIHSGVETTRMKVIVNPKPVKGILKNGGNYTYSQTYTHTLNSSGTSLGGEQVVYSMGMGTVSQWLTDTGAGYNNIQSFKAWIGMNPNSSTTGSDIYAAAVPSDLQLALTQTEAMVNLINFASIGQFVDIYFLKTKIDCHDPPETIWQVGYTEQSGGLAAIALPATGVFTGTAGSGIPAYVGAKPTDVKLFNRFYKVLKVRHCDLAAGASERLKVDLIHNYLGKADNFVELGLEGIVYPKGSLSIMFVISGEPVAITTSAHLTYGAVDTGFLVSAKHHFKPVAGQGPNTSPKYMVSNVPLQALASQEQVNAVDVSATVVAL